MASNTLVPRDLSLTNSANTNITSRNLTALVTRTTILDASELVGTSIISNSINSNEITTDTLVATDGTIQNLNATNGTIQNLNATNGTIQNLNATNVATFDQGLIITSSGKVTPTVPLNYFNSKDFVNATVTYGSGSTTTNFYFRRIADMVFVYNNAFDINGNTMSPLTTTNLTFTDSSFATSVGLIFNSPVTTINNTIEGFGRILLTWTSPTNVLISFYATPTLTDNWVNGSIGSGFISYRIN
jgi:hypothetical protein